MQRTLSPDAEKRFAAVDGTDAVRGHFDGPDVDRLEAGHHLIDVPRQASGARLDRYVADMLSDISRSRVQRWITIGAVRVDGEMRLPKYRLRGFERIDIKPQPLQSEQAWRPEPVPLAVLHADEDVIVVDKSAGLVTHPAPGHWGGTLLNGLLHAYPETASLPRAGIVHRLDRGTTGVMVCARSERAFVSLSAQLAQRSMRRLYVAVAGGRLAARGSFQGPIGRDPRQRVRMAVVQGPSGAVARTDYRRLDVQGEGVQARTAVLCKLHTGRTHQIRVHFSSAGHALLGDALYGGARATIERQALHSWQLAFEHPDGGAMRCFDAPIPDDLWALAAQCGLSLADDRTQVPTWTTD